MAVDSVHAGGIPSAGPVPELLLLSLLPPHAVSARDKKSASIAPKRLDSAVNEFDVDC